MPNLEHLPHAPIEEATLFVECYPPVDFNSNAFTSFCTALQTEYPSRGTGLVTTSTVQLTPEAGSNLAKAETDLDAHIFWSQDKQSAIILRRQGYAYTCLKPYPGWEEFQLAAEAGWQVYQRVFSPERVLRLGLRFINLIDLPIPANGTSVTLNHYFRTHPNLAPGMGGQLENFFMRLVVLDEEIPARAVVTQATEIHSDSPGDYVSLTFDIEVATTAVDSPEQLWESVAQLRAFKNRLFFSSITDQMQSMFR